jgi:hypothetical protein
VVPASSIDANGLPRICVYQHTLRATWAESTRALDRYIPGAAAKPALRLVKKPA